MTRTSAVPDAVVNGAVSLQGVACSSATICQAVGYSATSAVVVTITNGIPGSPKIVPGVSDLIAVACPGPKTCVAVGRSNPAGGVVVPIVNGIPGAPIAVPAATQLSGVACTSVPNCVAVGSVGSIGVVVPITNLTPGVVQQVTGATDLVAVACPGANACEAVGNFVDFSQFFSGVGVVVPITNGNAGTAQQVYRSHALNGIACTSRTDCEAVGVTYPTGPHFPPAGFIVSIHNGAPGNSTVVGSAFASQGPVAALTAIACRFTCIAVGNGAPTHSGVAVPISSGYPGTIETLTPLTDLLGVACDTNGSCQAVGGDFAGTGVVFSLVLDATQCAVTAPRAGPPKQEDITVQDSVRGVASITNISIINGSVTVAPFTPGTTAPVVVTATKADPTATTVLSFDVTDTAGNIRHCA